MQSRVGNVEAQSAQEWAESFKRTTQVPRPVLSKSIPGPGWLDDDTPCACSRVRILYGPDQLDRMIFSIEQLIARPLPRLGPVCTFDPKDKGTNASQ